MSLTVLMPKKKLNLNGFGGKDAGHVTHLILLATTNMFLQNQKTPKKIRHSMLAIVISSNQC